MSKIDQTIQITYLVGQESFSAQPASEEELVALAKAVGEQKAMGCEGGAPCSGDYVCVDGWRYRCMYDDGANACRWFRTNEVC